MLDNKAKLMVKPSSRAYGKVGNECETDT